MNIDFIKLINLLLPTSLRSGLTDIIKACASALTSIYASWQSWYADIVLQSAITCQVMYMELIINYRIFGNYNRTIYITDGDQVTVDFIVNVPQGVTYNVQLLIGLLEKYKATGKRYMIEQTQFVYEINWTDFVCEKINQAYEVSWIDFVCEKISSTEITFDISYDFYLCQKEVVNLIDNQITVIANVINGIQTRINATAEFAVTSDVTITVHFANTGNEYTVLIPYGSVSGSRDSGSLETGEFSLTNVSPVSDDIYTYKI